MRAELTAREVYWNAVVSLEVDFLQSFLKKLVRNGLRGAVVNGGCIFASEYVAYVLVTRACSIDLDGIVLAYGVFTHF